MDNPTLTPLETLEDFLNSKNIKLIKDNNIVDENAKAFIVKYNQHRAIIYAPDRLTNDIETRWVLKHEYYHDYIDDGYYKLNDSLVERKVIEGRVTVKQIKDMIPYETLIYYLKKETPLYEIAEELFVPEYAVKQALEIYEAKIIEEFNK